MGPIVCATRGGRVCRCTQERAIHMAKEQNAKLIFLFVADASFAQPIVAPLETALTDELTRLGRSLLYIAQGRARKQGVKADMVVRQGKVQESIEEFVRQVNASTLVIGAPQTSSVPQTFSSEQLSTFAKEVQETTGAQVVVESQTRGPLKPSEVA